MLFLPGNQLVFQAFKKRPVMFTVSLNDFYCVLQTFFQEGIGYRLVLVKNSHDVERQRQGIAADKNLRLGS